VNHSQDAPGGRAPLGGRQRVAVLAWRRAHAVPVEFPAGYVVHLVPTVSGRMGDLTACGRAIAAAAPATSRWRRVCAVCDQAFDSGCER